MNVVVTGGGTIAPIDDVRHITNVSTGRFSAGITEACLRRDATVWHVHGRSAELPFRRDSRFDLDAADVEAEFERLRRLRGDYLAVRERLHLRPLPVGDLSEYARELSRCLREAPIEVVFLAMAASDYEPEPSPGKLSSDSPSLTLSLRRTPKVIRSVRDWAPSAYLVGFKLLSGSPPDALIEEARKAAEINRVDLVVANDLGPLREGRHTVHLVRPGQPTETLGPGGPIAEALVDRVFRWAAETARIGARG